MSDEKHAYSSLHGRRILVTGGSGYIGSHTVLALLKAGAIPVVVDNLVNSSIESLKRVAKIAGVKEIEFHKIDLRDLEQIRTLFKNNAATPFSAVIHFAGLKAVGESVSQPLRYYDYNVNGAIQLFKTMDEFGVRNLVFSSSATVYGLPKSNPITEDFALSTTNPYGATKLMIEDILRDIAKAPTPTSGAPWRIIALRYFNPVGAHESGLIGEDPNGIPNNLVPFITQVAVGKREKVNVFGNDYDTPDGTGVRDYIHVMDLADGHLAALANGIFGSQTVPLEIYNLGTGHGVSVLEVIRATEKACGHSIPYTITSRRPGDIATCYADCSKAASALSWHATHTLQQSLDSAWKWQQSNPNGYSQ